MVSPTYRRRTPEDTLLHEVVREHLATFLEWADARSPEGRGLPRYVKGAFERFLDCGILANGFVRVRCPDCGYDTAVGFSCKERGLCPSCTGRRMDEVAANLVDRVFPRVPVRQWVLSMPHAVRFYLAKDAQLLSGVLRIFVDEIFRDYRRRARPRRQRDALCGGVTAIQRFGGALNLNVHFHSLLLDGVYMRDEFTGELKFQMLPDPSTENVARLAWVLRAKILKYLAKKGCFVGGEAGSEAAAMEEQDPTLLDAVQAASVREWVALTDKPHRVETAGRQAEWALPPEKPLCGRAEGFTLHAAVEISGGDRKGLEKLCRYVLRPPFSSARLERLSDGRIAYGFRKARPDGSTHVILEPLAFLEKLAALVPPPRAHLVRYHGVLAPRGGERKRVVPQAPPKETGDCGHEEAKSLPSPEPVYRPPAPAAATKASPVERAPGNPVPQTSPRPPPEGLVPEPSASPTEPSPWPKRWDWASLMKRGLDLDVLDCPRCHGRMKVLGAIEDPDVIPRMLRSMGLPAEVPARAPSRPPPQGELEFDH